MVFNTGLTQLGSEPPYSKTAIKNVTNSHKWRPPSLSELNTIILYIELTHFGSEASKYKIKSIDILRFKWQSENCFLS